MSLRDRFFTPGTAKAIMSWRLLAGVVVGALVTALGAPWYLGVGAGVAGYAVLVGLAMPRAPQRPAIDPFALGEPWRQFVQGALRSAARLRDTVDATAAGPLRDRVAGIAGRLEHGLDETWRIARRGDEIDDAVRRLDPTALDSKLETLRQLPESPERDQAIASVENQLASVARLKAQSERTASTLRLSESRYDELVGRAAEISVGTGDTGEYEHDVESLVIELEGLRLAVEETRTATASGSRTGVARLLALVAAVLMVAGALFVRRTVLDDDGTGDTATPSSVAAVLWCLPELETACRAAAGAGVEVVVRDPDAVLAELATAAPGAIDGTVWVTFGGLPEAADQLRAGAGRPALDGSADAIAQTPVVGVSPAPLDTSCAATPFDCGATIGFARPPYSATRWLTTVVVLDAAIDGGTAAAATSLGVVAARPLLTSLPDSRLSSPSAIATMCSRPTFDVALGTADASTCAARDLSVTYSDTMSHAVVVVRPLDGGAGDTSLARRLRDELVAAGWDPYAGGAGPDAASLLTARTVWSQM